jgi:hypothetical protein
MGWERLPLHVKHVAPLDCDALEELEVEDAATRQAFVRARRWLDAPEAYHLVPQFRGSLTDLHPARLSTEDVARMQAASQISAVDPAEALGTIRVFSVPEVAKQRRRAIKHTELINDLYPKESLDPVQLPLRAEQSAQSASGRYAVCLDFAAYFDQFQLSEEVSRLMCFRHGGQAYRLLRMPMGQRQAVSVAQFATNLMLSFPMPLGVTVQSCIDNVRFVGPREGVEEAATCFVRRCRRASVTINELPDAGADREGIAALIHQEGDWLGARYDYAHGRQKLAEKTVSKLRTSWARRAEWTHRDYAAHMGLLFFAASVLHTRIGDFFEAMKQLRLRSRTLTEQPALWDQPMHTTAGEELALLQWTQAALANPFVACTSPKSAERVLVTDASDWGWGAVLFDSASGAIATHGEAWTDKDRAMLNTGVSAHCEPNAVYRALCRFIRPDDNRPLLILTDSTTARYAIERGYSPSFAVNSIANRIAREFGGVPMRLEYIKGALNVADAPSRGAPLPPSYEVTQQLARLEALKGEPLLRQAMGCARPT